MSQQLMPTASNHGACEERAGSLLVLCAYTSLDPRTRKALEEYAPGTEFVETPAGDDFAYWRALAARWTGDNDLVVIEHDIEIGPDTIASFQACPEPWCVYAYQLFGSTSYAGGLGCVKFSAALQRQRWPVPRSHWKPFDFVVARWLGAGGYRPHVHGEVVHLRDFTVRRPWSCQELAVKDAPWGYELDGSRCREPEREGGIAWAGQNAHEVWDDGDRACGRRVPDSAPDGYAGPVSYHATRSQSISSAKPEAITQLSTASLPPGIYRLAGQALVLLSASGTRAHIGWWGPTATEVQIELIWSGLNGTCHSSIDMLTVVCPQRCTPWLFAEGGNGRETFSISFDGLMTLTEPGPLRVVAATEGAPLEVMLGSHLDVWPVRKARPTVDGLPVP